jgi:hypothetical protein
MFRVVEKFLRENRMFCHGHLTPFMIKDRENGGVMDKRNWAKRI